MSKEEEKGDVGIRRKKSSGERVTGSSLSVTRVPLEAVPYPCKNLRDFLLQSKKRFDENWPLNITGKPCKLEDFVRKRTLGMGSFGRVILVQHVDSGNYYAMKIMEKRRIVRTKQLENTLNEKKILQLMYFPFVVYMEYFIKDSSYLYYVMPFVAGGELFSQLQKVGRFREAQACFYAAQVVLALEYLHYLDLIYRDLKLENILLDTDGYLKITDFGFCKLVKDRTYTLCGTPEYLAPEIILSKGYGKAVDWWATGVLIYEMCAGYPPFFSREPMQIYEKIVQGKINFIGCFSSELKDILTNIIQVDTSRRFGNLKNGVNDIKDHKWFHTVKWLALFNKQVVSPFIPTYKKQGDTTNFDVFGEEPLVISATDKYAKEFEDF